MSDQVNFQDEAQQIKSAVFTPEELDYVICALIRHQSELRSRAHPMERFASPEHLAKYLARIALGEKLLADLS
jgi:hypothetical protein